ncbi:MAG: elongation factor P [Candidatus Colwellbacteria bacterium]|jgi:elongation factor P|nr:elongation factor P [Candidatus Colwellbacteria bacterium]MCK9497704.1 elongation factor P [Candidatus Colwellbacteria bacterium]MDD3752469.1 elongation factor P [Candidatus Colwellbacteria bacterium]
MISYTELKKGTIILLNNDPYEVVDTKFVRMQQRKAVVQSKLKNLKSGKVIDKSWQASENIEEADFQKQEITFIYSHKGEFWFQEKGNPQNRMMVPEDAIGDNANFLKPQTDVTAYILEGEIIKIVPPIKVEVEVTEAPPAVKGNTAQGGDKMVTVETGAKVTVPLFINQGDIIRINTETGSYVERVEKN